MKKCVWRLREPDVEVGPEKRGRGCGRGCEWCPFKNDWCLRMLLGIKWHQFVQSRRLTHFQHIARVDDNAYVKRILSTLSPEDWRRQWGCPRITWLSTIPTGSEIPQLHSAWSSGYSPEPVSVEDVVDVISSCMPETTMLPGILVNGVKWLEEIYWIVSNNDSDAVSWMPVVCLWCWATRVVW